MLRADKKVFKKLAYLLLVGAAVLPLSLNPVRSYAAGENELYFDALDEKQTVNISTTTVKKGVFFISGAVPATLDYPNNTVVFSDINEGTVYCTEILVGQGDTVKKGDPIVFVRVEVDAIEREEVEMNLSAAENNLNDYISDTKLLLDQYSKASKQGSISDMRMASLSYDRLLKEFKEEVDRREEVIEQYELRLAKMDELAETTVIKSPADGTIGYMNRMRKGEVIQRRGFLCVINDPSEVSVVVEGGSELLRYNMPVKVVQSNGSSSVELTGRVLTMKTTANSVNLMANNDIIEVYGDTSKLQPDREVSIKFDKIYVEDAMLIAKSALKSDKSGNYVNILVNGTASKRYVVVGGTDGTKCWIVSGIGEDDIIITD